MNQIKKQTLQEVQAKLKVNMILIENLQQFLNYAPQSHVRDEVLQTLKETLAESKILAELCNQKWMH